MAGRKKHQDSPDRLPSDTKNQMLHAHLAAREISERGLVAYYQQHSTPHHVQKAHEEFAKLAETLGYAVTKKDESNV